MSLTAVRYEHIFVANQQISLDTGATMHMTIPSPIIR